MLVRAPASNWFSNPNAAEANECGCSAPGEKPIHNPTALGLSSAVNGQPAGALGWTSWRRRRQVDSVLGDKRSDSLGTVPSCERSQELL